jgi:hypothetical protein
MAEQRTGRPARHLTAVTRRAATASGADPGLLAGFLDVLVDVSRTGRRLARHELADRRQLGGRAARSNVPLSTLVDLYLGATRLAWTDLPDARGPRAHDVAAAVLCAVNEAIVALAEGYGEAQRTAIHAEELERREFIDDLLLGGDPGRLAERADRFGLQLAAHHVVAVASGPEPYLDAGPTAESLRRRLAGHTVLVTTKDGLLVCVAPGGDADPVGDHLRAMVGAHGTVGVGRTHPGAGGVARSYADARTALDLARRLKLPAHRLRGADLVVYQVLGRDRAALIDLVTLTLEPLRTARGGPRPLLDTLTAYFGAGSAAAAARTLHLSIRALTYRLDRVHHLTGYDPTDPVQRYTLETAVLGARLLDWPEQSLSSPG